ncbi:MAG TPA: hypothetical protein VFF52_11970 [Isosphaeraceae bacterium]|nr:hypothetical protein [Isosphaeraceae bacterium]
MMSIDQIRHAMHQQPFLPFTVHTAGGQSFLVKHPDFIATSPTGRMITVWDDAGHHILDVGLVTQISGLHAPAGAQ